MGFRKSSERISPGWIFGSLFILRSLSVMIVRDLDADRVPVAPREANPPLVVDRNAPLALAVSRQRVQPVPWRDSQIREADGRVDDEELALGGALDIRREPPGDVPVPNSFGFLVLEGSDHSVILIYDNTNVKRY